MANTPSSSSSPKLCGSRTEASSVVVMASVRAAKRAQERSIERFLDYVSPAELDLLTCIRSGNHGLALTRLFNLLPEAINADLIRIIDAYRSTDKRGRISVLNFAINAAELAQPHKAPVIKMKRTASKAKKKNGGADEC